MQGGNDPMSEVCRVWKQNTGYAADLNRIIWCQVQNWFQVAKKAAGTKGGREWNSDTENIKGSI